MLGRLLLWARRHSREAVALALAPGLVALTFDAAIAHWAVLFLLPSARLLLRLRVGTPPRVSTGSAEVVHLQQDQRRAG